MNTENNANHTGFHGMSHEMIDAVAGKALQKLQTRDLFNAARYLVSMGFHVIQGKDAFKSSLPFSGDIDIDELKNPFNYYKMSESGELAHSSGARLQLLRNLALEITSHDLQGSIAEFGVFKGDFAVEIRKVLPDRRFYLFDTFEGFAEDTVKTENANFPETRQFHAEGFKNASASFVLSRFAGDENCVLKKGLFSDTKDSVDDNFVFVSIDTDFYDSILEGLEFFYPRLVPGGYIMVHDYNNPELTGAGAAVREFCEKRGIGYMPDADISAVITVPRIVAAK